MVGQDVRGNIIIVDPQTLQAVNIVALDLAMLVRNLTEPYEEEMHF